VKMKVVDVNQEWEGEGITGSRKPLPKYIRHQASVK
jgi:hypothetical protein